MGIERSYDVVCNNTKDDTVSYATEEILYKKFSYLNLMSKDRNLFNDNLFKKENDYYTTPFEDELAVKNPIRFIANFVNHQTISNAIKNNSNIKEILLKNKLPISFKTENVTEIIVSHLLPTAKKAQTIYLNMGHNSSEINYIRLTQAALLHDIGKAFIPEEILNKKGKLNSSEREIIELHNKLSYEILKTTVLHPLVAKLAFEHHDYDDNLKKTHENQALMIADIYCALREKRPYKKPLNDLMAKMILYDIGTKGKIDSRYINCIN